MGQENQESKSKHFGSVFSSWYFLYYIKMDGCAEIACYCRNERMKSIKKN